MEMKMSQLKMDALEKGELTDVSFLVGPDDDKAEVVHCFKSDLLVASEYFRALFRSPLTGPSPIRLKHIQPHIFRILSMHISTHRYDKKLSIEDAVDLAHAADEFLLDHLMPDYLKIIEEMITVENLWMILNRSTIPQVKDICKVVLSTKTRECLAHESFLEASQESFVFLLQLEEMNIESESELVDACLKMEKTKSEEEKGLLIKAALPHLRLLTLRVDEIQLEFLEYLSDSERSHLMLMMSLAPTEKSSETPDPSETAIGNLCLTKLRRSKYIAPESLPLSKIYYHYLNIFPRSKIITDYADMFKADLIVNRQQCSLSIVPAYNIVLHAIDILTPAKLDPLFTVKENSDKLDMEKVEFRVTINVQYDSSSRNICQRHLWINESYNTWHRIRLNEEVGVPKGVGVRISVVYHQKYDFFAFSEEESKLTAKHRAFTSVDLFEGNSETFTCFMIQRVIFRVL